MRVLAPLGLHSSRTLAGDSEVTVGSREVSLTGELCVPVVVSSRARQQC